MKSRDAICIQKDNYSLDLVFTKSNYTAVEKNLGNGKWQQMELMLTTMRKSKVDMNKCMYEQINHNMNIYENMKINNKRSMIDWFQ